MPPAITVDRVSQQFAGANGVAGALARCFRRGGARVGARVIALEGDYRLQDFFRLRPALVGARKNSPARLPGF